MKKYLNPKNYLNYFFSKTIHALSFILSAFESRLRKNHSEQALGKHPPIFIIGAPRCGSTLLYKVLTERYDFMFFSNLTSHFFRTPLVGMWLAEKLGVRARADGYDFSYGNVRGLGSPHECGAFWYRWFPKGLHVYVPQGAADTRTLQELRSEIGAMTSMSGRSLIFKNLYNSMRIAPIVGAMPEACFIVCKRDLEANASSILKGRIKNLNDKKGWWSLPPAEIDELLEKEYADQVVGQVYYTMRQIEKDRRRFNPDRFLEIEYEDLRADVYCVLETIRMFLRKRGLELNEQSDVPRRFEVVMSEGLEESDRRAIQRAARALIGGGANV